MRLLQRREGHLHLTEDLRDNEIPPYAVLSHTWGDPKDEVNFKDMVEGTGRHKAGYEKIVFCGKQAARDDLQHFWVDICCINKSSSAELQEAIISMFRWYERATKCYVYLADVSTPYQYNQWAWEQAFRGSRWFTRGWTLQELLAPQAVEFFSREGRSLGDKENLENLVQEITRIDVRALRGIPISHFKTNERFLWAKIRHTTRGEDEAYSLLGIFGITMPIMYGEGRERAMNRLRHEIHK
ncbi:HET-domain-containing protein, partial [Viridothelium virens]